MKRFMTFALGAALVGLLAMPAATMAQDDATGDQTKTRQRKQRPDRKTDRTRDGQRNGRQDARRGGHPLRGVLSQLNLTEEQQGQVKEALGKLREKHAETFKANREKAQELRTQIQEARKAGDEDKVKELMEQAKALRPDREAVQKELTEALAPILTEEQNAKLAEGLKNQQRPGRGDGQGAFGDRIRNSLKALNLTEEQTTQVNQIIEAAGASLKDAEPKQRRELFEKMMSDIKNVLGEEKAAEWQKTMKSRRGQRDGQRDGNRQRPQRQNRDRNKDQAPAED